MLVEKHIVHWAMNEGNRTFRRYNNFRVVADVPNQDISYSGSHQEYRKIILIHQPTPIWKAYSFSYVIATSDTFYNKSVVDYEKLPNEYKVTELTEGMFSRLRQVTCPNK